MDDVIDPYSPCFCGSGKKYRFCCKGKSFNFIEQQPKLIDGDPVEGERLHIQGTQYMMQYKFDKAIQCYTKSLEVCKGIVQPVNNLALCLFISGKPDEAIRVQRQCINDSHLANPCGVANLSLFFYFLGLDKEADKAISAAASMKSPGPEATTKVCEMLARFKRHEEVIEIADASDYAYDPQICFYTGIAAANLGNFARATRDLQNTPDNHPKARQIKQYLQHLRNNTRPNTIRKDWPYLAPDDYFLSFMDHNIIAPENSIRASRYMVDYAEASINANPDQQDYPEIAMLQYCQHPEAAALLWIILKGDFGSVNLRYQAANSLAFKGEIKPDEKLKFVNEGRFKDQQLFSICLNPDFVFCEIPPTIEQRYVKLIQAGHQFFANWEKIGKGYLQLINEAPHYFPAYFNYAICLINCKRLAEAEEILHDLTKKHPKYLFAKAALLSILVHSNRIDEAKKLVRNYKPPKETHPDAFAAWLVSMTTYCEAIGDNREAFLSAKMAYQINPKDKSVRQMWRLWKGYNEKEDTSLYLKMKRKYKNLENL